MCEHPLLKYTYIKFISSDCIAEVFDVREGWKRELSPIHNDKYLIG